MARYDDHRDYGRDEPRSYGSDRQGYGSDHRDERESGGDRRNFDRGVRRDPVTCFNCGELGHYANQCPHPRKQPSTSSRARSMSPGQAGRGDNPRTTSLEPLQPKVAEIGKSVAAVCQYVEFEQQKKAAKEKRKAERKEAAERLENERREAELKKKRKEEKAGLN
ncbi:hypothetical protein CBR_g45204 [Chara braunii]|uniref:CCHC-type domain-containing protein n=1 Tax=Chara braunii TaxID=69332 RepID=A0A388K384_CHABU|nr:hypothetical protein CBR_g45204 [Chara braunii]|eukprot:GBG64508.1 hypothetical protein CBR_g45204 [Chara braunii]